MARPKPTENIVLCSFRLPQSLVAALQQLCKDTELTMTQVAKKALRDHLCVYPTQAGAAK